jgi:dolichol-phosphate mannosyltransferase
MAMITGAMCFLMGLLAELLVRTYYESQQKTTYTISTVSAAEAPVSPELRSSDTAARRQ